MTNDKILATVQNLTVTQAEVDEMITMLTQQRGQDFNNPQGRAMVLEQLINKKLLLLDASKNLYEHNPEFKAQLQKVKEDMLADYAIGKALEKIDVKEDEIKAFYEENKEKFNTGETVNASHILVDAEDKASEIMKKIENGDITFEDAAKQNSSCPSSQNGGNLGDFTKGQMVPEFDEACFSMNEGEMMGPVKTQFGYHIIKLNSKKPPQIRSYEEVKDGIKRNILSEKQHKAYESKLNQLKILYPVTKY